MPIFEFLQKYANDDASAVLSRLAAESVKLPAILEKKRRISKKFRPGSQRKTLKVAKDNFVTQLSLK